ncbi:hypothetical protein BDP27DRAFT_1316243 [Rhodocollybia butyracea]|uniref:Uncharacterized protein n=1 Tax=Rhodocollybia butyracea TaxID=206335 RepID=A0A9P5UDA4_9AGAR|nr:hypothetical protein BDP27DRAFT_1316243 [Rhodocollybia butyracea]
MKDFRKISLPYLDTLAISCLTGQLMYQVAHRWSLPSLSHIILGAVNVPDVSELWEIYGTQLKSLELGLHASFLVRDVISSLDQCPNLEELNYHIFFTLPMTLESNVSNESIHTVGLHAAPNLMFSPDDAWVLAERHFEVLSESFSSLRILRLFGDWSQILGDSRFEPIYVKLRQRGCEVVVF